MRNKSRPRILLIGPLPPPAGGIATATRDLLTSELKEEFVLLHVNNSTKQPVNKKGKISILNAIGFASQIFLSFVETIYYRPHIVQIESSSGISFLKNSFFVLIAKLTFRKVIISIHGSGLRFIQFYRGLPFFGRSYVRSILLKCNMIRILSDTWISAFISEFGLERSKICVIPNAVRLEDFNKGASLKDQLRDRITLLFLGWVGEKKGIFDLLDSVEILESKGYQFKLLVVGPEMKKGDADRVRKAVAHKHLEKRVMILGEKERREALKYYYAADIYVLPSYSEGLPLGILEAMAAGLPIVATKVGAIPEIIKEGINGFLIDPGDVPGLASKIELLVRDRALRERIGANNVAKIRKEYSLAVYTKMFKKLYLGLLKQS